MEALAKEWLPDTVLVDEEFQTNRYIENSYDNPKEYSFRSQLHQLITKVQSTRDLPTDKLSIIIPAISDLLYEKTYFGMGNISEEDNKTYTKLYDVFEEGGLIVKPDIILHLSMEQKLVQKRIVERGRGFEKDIDPVFLSTLFKNFLEYIEKTDIPVIPVGTGYYDFREENIRKVQASWISSRITIALQNKFSDKTSGLLYPKAFFSKEVKYKDIFPGTNVESRGL